MVDLGAPGTGPQHNNSLILQGMVDYTFVYG